MKIKRKDLLKLYISIREFYYISRILCFDAVLSKGNTAFFYSTRKRVNYSVYQKNNFLRWFLPFIRAPPFDLKSDHFKSNGGYSLKIFYIEHENGNYFSVDGSRRFIRLTGRKAYKYLSEHNTGVRYFYPTSTQESTKHNVFVEVAEKDICKIRKEVNHKKYLDDLKKESPIICISLLDQADGEEDLLVQDTIVDESTDIEEKVIHEIELEMLRRALQTLSDDELKMIHSLYLSDSTLTERELGEKLGVPQTTISYRKRRILKKLENILK